MNLSEFKAEQTDRQLVEQWLDSISEFDPECRNEVLQQCKKLGGRVYYVARAKDDLSRNNP